MCKDGRLFAERPYSPKSSQISEEPMKVAETSACCDEEPSGPTASTALPDNVAGDSVASDVEEQDHKTDVADSLLSTVEGDA